METPKQKFEVKEKNAATYGIWNNDMDAWQFIYNWNSTETVNIDTAHDVCEQLNLGIIP